MARILSTYEVASDSDPNRTYSVIVYDTHTTCECRAWKMSKLPEDKRVCKHIEKITGEVRRGDARLTDAEATWIMRKLLGTEKSFEAIACAIGSELPSLSDNYDRMLAEDIIAALRGLKQWEDDEVPGPDAQRALGLIQRALGEVP